LTFTSAPFSQPLVIVGSMQVHLRAVLSAHDGNLVVKVVDVAPDGTAHQVSVGYLKASHRLSQSRLMPVVPGRLTDFVISVWPMDWRLKPGHRLRLSLTSGDYPKIAADAPRGTVTVVTGKGGSYVDFLARG
jgi:putative CocE/NonD family hydrolase